jgi:tellurite resistance protein TerA
MPIFARGQKGTLASLGASNPSPLVTVSVALELSGSPEADVCCFGLDANGKLSHERYF